MAAQLLKGGFNRLDSVLVCTYNIRMKRVLVEAEPVVIVQAGAHSTLGSLCNLKTEHLSQQHNRHWNFGRGFFHPISTVPVLSNLKENCKGEFGGEFKILCKEGQWREAVYLLDTSDQQGSLDYSDIYLHLLQGCTNMKALGEGKVVHACMIRYGFNPNVFLETTLVNMYLQCGSLEDAHQVFVKMVERDVLVWNLIIAANVNYENTEEAFKLFQQMEQDCVLGDDVTFVSILKVCGTLRNLKQGKLVHARINSGVVRPIALVENSLIDMYAKCGSLDDAHEVFDQMAKRDVVSWTLMITGYCMRGHARKALSIFWQMEYENVVPDKVTFLSVLKACISLGDLEKGRQIHSLIIKFSLDREVFVGSTLVDMYSKCGSIKDAQKVFDAMPVRDVVSWNSMIAGYAKHGHVQEVFVLFGRMDPEIWKPSKVTFLSILSACASLGNLELCKQVHAYLIKDGFDSDEKMMSSLLDMYAKCGSIVDARRVFDRLKKRDVVTWTAMIAGYAQQGHGEEVFKFLEQMTLDRVRPDKLTFVSIVNACSGIAALEQGRQIHALIIKNGLESDTFVGSALIDMYSKGGNLEDARHAFEDICKHDVVSWTAMIVGYAQHGCGNDAIKLFGRMLDHGVKLNHITFVGFLSACSHSGLVDEARYFFNFMSQELAITQTAEHFACMIDLLGRAGCLEEAEVLMKEMSFEPSISMWLALLGSCRIYRNVDLAKRAAECVLRLEPQNAAAFVLLSNVYAAAGMWDSRANVVKAMLDRGIKKELGQSIIEVNNKKHVFFTEDTSHPAMDKIYAELKSLADKLSDAGYVPDIGFTAHVTEPKVKDFSVCLHSEKLAIAFGLISSPARSIIKVLMNLRMCGNCHAATKFISKIAGREIVVRDANQLHLFKNGFCSCGDSW